MVWDSQAAGRCERLVASGNPDYPPFLWRDPEHPGQLIGASADLLKHIGKAIGVDIEILYVGPWSRAQQEARTGRIDMLAGAFVTLPRLEVMDYVYPAAFEVPSMVWLRNDAEWSYGAREDLVGHAGATLVNNSFGQDFDEFAREHLQLSYVPKMSQAFDMLAKERIDYVLFERDPGLALTRDMGLQEAMAFREPPISSEGLYLTVSHNSACNDAWLRGQLSQQMIHLAVSGLPERLLQENLARWASQQEHLPSEEE